MQGRKGGRGGVSTQEIERYDGSRVSQQRESYLPLAHNDRHASLDINEVDKLGTSMHVVDGEDK